MVLERGIEPPTYALRGLDTSVFPLIHSDINIDGTLYRKVDTTLMSRLCRLQLQAAFGQRV